MAVKAACGARCVHSRCGGGGGAHSASSAVRSHHSQPKAAPGGTASAATQSASRRRRALRATPIRRSPPFGVHGVSAGGGADVKNGRRWRASKSSQLSSGGGGGGVPGVAAAAFSAAAAAAEAARWMAACERRLSRGESASLADGDGERWRMERRSETSVIAPPKAKIVKTATSSVVCSTASESVIDGSVQCAASRCGCSRWTPPQCSPKSWLPKETEASAKATPPRSPLNHITNLYSGEIGGGSLSGARQRLVSHEPR